MADAGETKVRVYEMSTAVRHYEISFEGAGLARLYCEVFDDAEGRPQSTSRLHFDGDVRPEIMRQVIDLVVADVLTPLPRGVCVIYRGHLFSSFDYGKPPATT